MTEETPDQSRDAESHPAMRPRMTIPIAPTQTIDLSGLTTEQIQELTKQYASGMLDISKKAQELKLDVAALETFLSSTNDQVAKASETGTHATITHTQTSAFGRTEVVIGNTDKAAKGKISRSAAGEKDIRLWVIGILAFAGIVIAVIIAG